LIFSRQTGRDFKQYYTSHYDARLIARDRKKKRIRGIFRLKRWINRFVPDLQSVDLMEIGCGTGRLLESLQIQGMNVCGVEPGLRAADLAKGRIGEENVLCCILADVSIEKQFDLIIMIQTLEHLEEPLVCLEKIKSMLRPQGLIFIEVPNFFSLRGFFSSKQQAHSYPSPNHLFVYTRRTLAALVKKTGFDVISLSGSFRNIRLVVRPKAKSTKGISVKTESYPRVYLFFLAITGLAKIKDIFRSLYLRVVDIR
jgi:2-polyprenyl-3-methyl-5-hydroxy-6-metoxy-1,4-benzoquinol methylase